MTQMFNFTMCSMASSMHFRQQIGRASPGLDKELLLKGVNDTNVQAYLQFMIDVAVMFGANRTSAQDEMLKVLEFEESLAEVYQLKTTTIKSDSVNHSILHGNYFFRFHSTNIIQSLHYTRLKMFTRKSIGRILSIGVSMIFIT